MGTKCVIAEGVFFVELLAYQVSLVRTANWRRKVFLYKRCKYWIEFMTSSIISFADFTHFSNLNVFRTNEGICKRLTVFYSFIESFAIHLKYHEVKI